MGDSYPYSSDADKRNYSDSEKQKSRLAAWEKSQAGKDKAEYDAKLKEYYGRNK